MDKTDSQVLPVPPNLLISFRAGFDAITNHIVIIFIPVIIDLILWLGPHFQIKTIILNFLQALLGVSESSSLQPNNLFTASEDLVRTAASQYNLLSLLRTIPVGIPSLMSGRLPTIGPFGIPMFIDVINPFFVLSVGLGTLLLGMVIGCFFYQLVVQASLGEKINLIRIIKDWPRAFIQVLSLTLGLLFLFIIISIPASCAYSAIAYFGMPLGQFAIFLYIGILLWLAFPLIFSAHGIFVNHNNAIMSVQRSMLMTRMTLSSTALFIFVVILASEGLDILWRVPPEESWLTLIGLGGHAFITTGLLAASFIYYRDADRWTQVTLKNLALQRNLSGWSGKGDRSGRR